MPPQSNTRVTIELGELIEGGFSLWDFEYPSYYKGDAKLEFERKVIDHYFFRQIGQETPARFKHYFKAKMREIMPYYIQLYESEALMRGIEDPFGNVDFTETYEETRSSSHEGTSSASDESSSSSSNERSTAGTDRFSDTPQGTIDNLDHYLTTARKTTDSGSDSGSASSSGSSSGTTTAQGTETVAHTFRKQGNQGVNTYAHDMLELRETFRNIDLEIIEALNDLFLLIY